VPKKRANLKVVSALTEHSPLTMAPIRVAGTRSASASAWTEIHNGRRNSSANTSPGCVVTRSGVPTLSVVIDDFDMGWTLLGSMEADAPLVVDADRILALAVACEGFQPIARRSRNCGFVPGLCFVTRKTPRAAALGLLCRKGSSAMTGGARS
jgi:hypothetical protein